MKAGCHCGGRMRVVEEYQDDNIKTKCIVKVWICRDCGETEHISPAFHLKNI